MQKDPSSGPSIRDVLAEIRELERPRGIDDVSVVHATERTPVRPPYVERVCDQDRPGEQHEQSEQNVSVPATHAPALISVFAHHEP